MINKNTILSMVTALALSSSTMFGASDVKVYATVNGSDITTTDIALVLKDPRIQFETLPEQNKKQILDQLIDRKLLGNKALKSDVINDEVYKTTLATTIEVLKQDLALQIWMQKLSKDISIDDAMVKKYYNDNKDKLQKQKELKASHILVKTDAEAKIIIAQLNKSKDLKESFTKFAKEKSTGPSGKTGGELGWFTEDKMVPEFSQASSLLKVGTITQNAVKTRFGYHIIYLDDKKEAKRVSFEESKNEIKQFLGQTKFKINIDKIIKDLKSKAKITYK